MKTAPPSTSPHSPRYRWFFALQPDATARAAIAQLQDELATRHDLRGYRIKPENLHVSLHFLGEGDALPESTLQAARAAAASVVFAPFELSFDRVESLALQREQKPFVLSTGAPPIPLKAFHRSLGTALRNTNIGTVRAGFTPHLTLFWAPILVARHDVSPINWTVAEFVLVRSCVGRARNDIVERWPLGKQDSTAPTGLRDRLTCPSRSRLAHAQPYAELHARSAFSFLRGASLPEDLVRCAMELNVPAMALLDRDGVYGAPRFYGSAQENKFAMRPRVGAEITMEDGTVVPLLVTNRTGYQNLCQLITEAKMTERNVAPVSSQPSPDGRLEAGAAPTDRKRPCYATWGELARFSEGLIALTGDEEGPVRSSWRTAGADAAAVALRKLVDIFGRETDPARARLFVELQRHQIRGEDREVDFLRDLAGAHRLPLLATGGVNYAIPEHRLVADVFACLRHHTTLDAAGRRLAVNSERHVKTAGEMQALFRDLPEALANSVRLEARLDFTLQNLGYQFPTFPTPPGESMDHYLREQTYAAARAK
ncbi:MAG TPA: PHP domain-containing protein, partial [Acidobacteriota bacterium]|nr:PHP domain-containing protein [Acidobacteriota bacterium]